MRYNPDITIAEASRMHRAMRPLLKRIGYARKTVSVSVMRPQTITCEPSIPNIETHYFVADKRGKYLTPNRGQRLALSDGDMVLVQLVVDGKVMEPRVTVVDANA